MKLISFEGIDASGKETQAKMLNEYMNIHGYKTTLVSFPRINLPIGKLIDDMLKNVMSVDIKALHMLYEVDRMDFRNTVKHLGEQKYDFLILDRYTHSNIAYGMANNIDYDWLKNLQRYIREPDITFLLNISVEESVKRRSERQDIFEKDLDFLKRVTVAYTLLAEKDSNIISIQAGGLTSKQLHTVILYYLQQKEFIK